MLLRRPISELLTIEKTLNKGRGSTIVYALSRYVNFDNLDEEDKAIISNKWDVMRQYPAVIQWFKDNGLEPRSS